MSDVTRILNAIERGDAKATDELLPLVYEELRILAAQKLSHEAPGQTLQATALVHEAYLRPVGDQSCSWQGRGHFFAAAAEAMRRILVENACTCQAALGPPRVDETRRQNALRRWHTWDRGHREVIVPCSAGRKPRVIGLSLWYE